MPGLLVGEQEAEAPREVRQLQKGLGHRGPAVLQQVRQADGRLTSEAQRRGAEAGPTWAKGKTQTRHVAHARGTFWRALEGNQQETPEGIGGLWGRHQAAACFRCFSQFAWGNALSG